MEALAISPDFTIEDIHKIREQNYERTLIVLKHPDDIKALPKDVVDERLICEPCVHKDIAGMDSGFQSAVYHCHGCIRLMADRLLTAFIAAFALVDFRGGAHDMLFRVRGGHHIKSDRDKAVAVCPSEGQHVEPFDYSMGDMASPNLH